MRNIESAIEKILMVAFLLFTILTFWLGIDSEPGDGAVIPQPMLNFNLRLIYAGIILSVICGLIFPSWNVRDHFRNFIGFEVRAYIKSYKLDFYFIAIGYVGLLICSYSKEFFNIQWTIGTACILAYFYWLLTPYDQNRSKAEDVV